MLEIFIVLKMHDIPYVFRQCGADGSHSASAESTHPCRHSASSNLGVHYYIRQMLLKVDAVARHAGRIEPVAFWLGENCLDVLEIVDRWPATDYTYFKVAASDQAIYILRHDAASDTWELTLCKSPDF